MASITRNRTDKGEAILAAALEVFGREGFADGTVEEIARQAGVAKPTVYNRFGDKQTLFVEALNHGIVRSGTRNLEAIDSIDLMPSDLRSELERLGHELVGCITHDEGAAVIRLQLTERPRFPEIINGDINRTRSVDALAGKLAQLATTGRLRITDPQRAARQFIALVTEDALGRSNFGARVLTAEDLDQPIRDGVDTFLAAFG